MDYPQLSDHAPILLPIPCDTRDGLPKQNRRLRVGRLSDEEWSERDEAISSILARKLPEGVNGLEPDLNAPHFCDILVSAIYQVFESERVRPPRPNRPDPDPLAKFLWTNLSHPKMERLLAAIAGRQHDSVDQLISQISVDNWRAHLETVTLSDTRALFAFLAKSERRKTSGFVPAGSAPLLDGRGNLVISHSDKVRLFTAAVNDRFTSPVEVAETGRMTHPSSSPLGPCRIPMTGTFQPVTRMEVQKAVDSLTKGKAPGPDEIPAEVYKRLPSLVPHLTVLANAIYCRGRIPKALRRVHVILLNKPGKDPKTPANRRPISLISTAMKLMESIVYRRLLPLVEPKLHPGQYAYRRARGAEHHLSSLMDLVQRTLLRGHFAYVVSFDVAGAFDTVSHAGLMSVIRAFNVDPYPCRFLQNWIGGRLFEVKYKSPHGTYYGPPTPIRAGLPQGGVLSPLLWLMYFNGLPEELRRSREARGDDAQA